MATNLKQGLLILTEEEKSKTNGGAIYDFLVTITGSDGGKTIENIGTIEFKCVSENYFCKYRHSSSIDVDRLAFLPTTLSKILDGGDDTSEDYRDRGTVIDMGTVIDAKNRMLVTTMQLVRFDEGLDFQSHSLMKVDLRYVESVAVSNMANYHEEGGLNKSWELKLKS